MKKILLFLILSCLASNYIIAQTRQIKGKILGEDNLPLPGVTITEGGGAVGTVSDSLGNYTLDVSHTTDKLVFEMLGQTRKVLALGISNVMDVTMSTNVGEMKEVLVVGYGTQEKVNITGSISTIKGKDIHQVPVASYDQALQGKVPGLLIQSPSAELGAYTKIRIRGVSSVSASNDPLIVIDGIPVTSQSQSNFSDNNPGNPMADLNQSDIESIEVLKDASAAAIYGSRGSNGVILITTRRGASGKTRFNLNYTSGIMQPTRIRKFLNREQYINMFNDGAKNSKDAIEGDYGALGTLDSLYDAQWSGYGGGPQDGVGSYSQILSKNYNSDWNKEAYRQGSFNQFDLSASGGTEKTKFYSSFGYQNQKGIIIRNSFQRLSGRLNIDHQATDKLKFGLNLNQNMTINNRIPENNSFGSPTQGNAMSPILPLIDPSTGEYNANTFYGNPYLAMKNSKDEATSLRNFSNVYAQYNFIKQLSFRTEWGVDLMNQKEYSWNGAKVPSSITTPSSGAYGTTQIINWTTNNTLNYNAILKENHQLDIILGQSFQKSVAEYSSIQGQGLPSDYFQYLDQASQNTSFSSQWSSFSYLSYLGRVNYKYKQKYLLSVSSRIDGSSRFGRDVRYGTFPGISGGWIITQEDFYKNSNLTPIISLLKLKASYGLTGNSEIGNFAALGLYNSSFYGGRGGIFPRQLPNPNLTWENTQQFDVGLEYGIFNNRISGGVDFYYKNTNGLLLARQIPQTSGYAAFTKNLGRMTTHGWDIYINSQNLTGAFTWSTNFNISTFKNTVKDVAGQEVIPSGRELNGLIEGQPIGVFYGVKYAGVDSENGDPLYQLANGTTTNSYSVASRRENLQVLGNSLPKHYGGMTNNFGYKGFDLSVLLSWIYGNKIYNSSGVFQSNAMSNGLDNQTVDQYDYWRKPGDVTNVPRPTLYSGETATPSASSRWLYDGSFLRFRTVSLGYTLPKKLIEKAKLTQVRIYVSAQNLFTITKYPGNDPEVNYHSPSASSQSVNITQGIDYYSPPQAKTYLVGLNIGF